jgi:DNA-binding CsgD family transcriptional regulator
LGAASPGSLDHRAQRAYVEALTAEREIALLQDDLSELIRLSDELIEATRGLGERHLIAEVDAATCLWYQNRFVDCAARLTRILEQSRAQVFPALTAEICHVLAYTRWHLGELDEVSALLDEAGRLEERASSRSRRTVPWVRDGVRHLVTVATGNWQEGLRALDDEITLTSDAHKRIRLRIWAAGLAARFGGNASGDVVLAQIEAVDANSREAGCARCGWEACLAGAEFYARTGEVARARARLRRWEATHPAPGPSAAWFHRHALALLAAADGDDDRAVELLQAAIDEARVAEMRMDELWALIDLGDVQVRAQRERAAATWRDALVVAQAVGAPSVRDLVQRRLRSIGVRLRPAASGSAVAGLSAREKEVARLAVAGARTREIATALFVSPKTVERHLSNIFAKLGVRNRAELSARYATAIAPGGPDSTD